jgi:hypothetical protein
MSGASTHASESVLSGADEYSDLRVSEEQANCYRDKIGKDSRFECPNCYRAFQCRLS